MKTKFTLIALLLATWPMFIFAQSHQLITTFTNPTPTRSDWFGASVAAFGNDRVLLGSEGGVAYLYNTSGTLLRNFTVSDPVAVGDRVVVSAFSYGTTAQNGRAYLFRSNRVLGEHRLTQLLKFQQSHFVLSGNWLISSNSQARA